MRNRNARKLTRKMRRAMIAAIVAGNADLVYGLNPQYWQLHYNQRTIGATVVALLPSVDYFSDDLIYDIYTCCVRDACAP